VDRLRLAQFGEFGHREALEIEARVEEVEVGRNGAGIWAWHS
jgi:hypothetical protein